MSQNCFVCHGPDDKQRKAKLRLDVKEATFKSVIVPGKSAESELIKRLRTDDAEERMPPAKTGKKLTLQQIELLKQWIDQGAKWSEHWAFVKPERPVLPALINQPWARNAIDHFILARHQREGLKPSPETDKTTLIRRVTLDLTGLPPTPAEVDAFLSNSSPDAYEKVVDRLLASPRYGERMALDWLDAARFADTHGYHIDAGRDMTRWREWVIDAFNNNMPFDQFTVEQLAGDLVPHAGLSQKIASGFNRNHMINFEGGAIPDEYHTAYIVDRINTTGTVWLGMTIGCAQCHDHKYDPMTQKEFYQLFAFFNNVPENGLDGSKGNAAPMLKVPRPEQLRKLEELAASIKKLDGELAGPLPEVDAAQKEWEKEEVAEKKNIWSMLDLLEFKSTGGATLTKLPDGSILANGKNPDREMYEIVARSPLKKVIAIRLEALTHPSLPNGGAGRHENSNFVLTNFEGNAASLTDPKKTKLIRFVKAEADYSQQNYEIAKAIDQDAQSGWAVDGPTKRENRMAMFIPAEPVIFDDDTVLKIRMRFEAPFATHAIGRFRLSVTEAKSPDLSFQRLPANIAHILTSPVEKRAPQQQAELRYYYRTRISPVTKPMLDQLAKLKRNQVEAENRIPTTMVMQELDKPRETFMLIRGQYDKKGEKVSAATPAFLPALPKAAPVNRLGLAQWLVNPAHPLTARVIVNRYWQMYFGTGLVKTSEDFGSQGELPSHSELLDWLATEFMTGRENQQSEEPGWNVKHLQRLIVTSATYRQSSAATPELFAKDPENRLLARMSRLRLPAEFIRDQALTVSGLLNGEIGGKSVSPYQPAGLWEELTARLDGANWTAQSYVQDHGKDLYRRTMYTFWKRTAPPPTLATFDAPDRETCTVRRPRTNTPLQALILMNDPTYVEAARKLAERMMTEAAPRTDDRISFAFRLVTARKPTSRELALLQKIFDSQMARFRHNPQAALKLLNVGEAKRNEKLDPPELAAWTFVATVILNLDEAVTRG